MKRIDLIMKLREGFEIVNPNCYAISQVSKIKGHPDSGYCLLKPVDVQMDTFTERDLWVLVDDRTPDKTEYVLTEMCCGLRLFGTTDDVISMLVSAWEFLQEDIVDGDHAQGVFNRVINSIGCSPRYRRKEQGGDGERVQQLPEVSTNEQN